MARWLLLGLLLLGSLAQGASLRVGIEAHDYYPYYRAEAEGVPKGYAVALLQAFAKHAGLELEIRAQPINRLYRNLLEEQSLDLLFPDNPAWSRQAKTGKQLYYSDAAIQIVDGTLVLNERRGQGLARIRQLGTVRGFTPQAWQPLLAKGGVNLVEAQDIQSLIRMVERGRLDALYANPEVVRYQLLEMGMPEGRLQLDQQLPLVYTSFHLSSPSHPELIQRFNRFLVEQQDQLAKLRRLYGLR
ncbi:ABC transporter substrate-binding protein [Pseudomonas sp.]|uniref:substrate-binding periplasmic protein n=1 Tax=Pseudomonas sp. TaxID=306 RepID=UPI002736D777|nr:transporter substrate-binding domain-containing protein [Pseudomonas sp.]MDP3815410.1 transporter substrate-binding domain-containing protein [Pseudomonas sp.]